MISENCCTFIVLNYKVVQTIIAMFTEDKVTEIFFMADEFHKVFCRMLDKYSLNAPKMAGKRAYHRAGKLSVPEIMTIMDDRKPLGLPLTATSPRNRLYKSSECLIISLLCFE